MKRSKINKGLTLMGGLTLLTGIFLLFHYESHFAKAVHQIAGFALAGFSITHININKKPLANSFVGRTYLWVMLGVFAVSLVIMAVTGSFAKH